MALTVLLYLCDGEVRRRISESNDPRAKKKEELIFLSLSFHPILFFLLAFSAKYLRLLLPILLLRERENLITS